MLTVILIIIVCIISGLFVIKTSHIKKETFLNNICSDNLTDLQYLQHMIPHHQVAVDISIMLQKKTNSPVMHDIIRKLIWIQKYEISLMKEMLEKLPINDIRNSSKLMNKNYMSTISDFTKPNKLGLTNTYCDPHFFDPKAHMKHITHMKLNDKMYIEHMIPHHQVAVDMSKVLLKNTKNNFMIYLAYRIIQSQQEEIILLNDLLRKENINFKSKLL